MEEKYKLQELQTKDIFTNKTLKKAILTIWLIGVIIISILNITEPFLWFIFAFAYSSIFGILALTIYLFPKNNTEYKQLKDIGNIGAHPAANVDVIVDVEPGEAETLLALINLIIRQTYIQRNADQELLQEVERISVRKAEQQGGAQ